MLSTSADLLLGGSIAPDSAVSLLPSLLGFSLPVFSSHPPDQIYSHGQISSISRMSSYPHIQYSMTHLSSRRQIFAYSHRWLSHFEVPPVPALDL